MDITISGVYQNYGNIGGFSLTNIGQINVILGKNGCGKSSFLRFLDQNYKNAIQEVGIVKYLSPERGGRLVSDSSVFDALQNDTNWGPHNRRQNRVDSFRQMSMAEFKILETLVLRTIESDRATRDSAFTFEDTINQINGLLDNVKLVRGHRSGFETKGKADNDNRNSDHLSSGESELISVAIEILSFIYQTKSSEYAGKTHILLLDEPDVHLHPDLQSRLVKLLVDNVRDQKIIVFIATHSTAFLGSLDPELTHVCFMRSGTTRYDFLPISEALEKTLPIFGAHPLSNVFNNSPILLVEGEDDERIWQQATRSSRGRIKVWPCAAGDIQSLDEYEDTVSSIINAVYDNAKAYSLRDRDGYPYDIVDKENVIRARLNCRAAENLILSDDVLKLLGTTWSEMQTRILEWISSNSNHPKNSFMMIFSRNFDRQNADLKELRLILMDLAGSNKPWEVAVGQGIAALTPQSSRENGSLVFYLGEKIVQALQILPNLVEESVKVGPEVRTFAISAIG